MPGKETTVFQEMCGAHTEQGTTRKLTAMELINIRAKVRQCREAPAEGARRHTRGEPGPARAPGPAGPGLRNNGSAAGRARLHTHINLQNLPQDCQGKILKVRFVLLNYHYERPANPLPAY